MLEMTGDTIDKKNKSKNRRKHFGDIKGLQRKFFGNVEYKENRQGNVVEIRASNGIFKIKNEKHGGEY